MRPPAHPARGGFTLFEVLGVILITTILLGAVVNFYIDLSSQATRASETTREVRRAAALLDRIAADLEHTLLVKTRAEQDPLSNPWVFVGVSRHQQGGSDRIKFVRRQQPRGADGPASDLEIVAYLLDRNEDGGAYELRRWSRPDLPESLDLEFPVPGDPDALLLTDDIEFFALRFLDDTGAWKEEWDSSQLVESSELPLAVEIEVALLDPLADDDDRFDALPRHYVRHVQLPLRPFDLDELLDPDAEGGALDGSGEDGDEFGDLTLADCIDFAKLSASDAQAAGLSATDLNTIAALAQNPNAPFAPYAGILGGHPAVNPRCR